MSQTQKITLNSDTLFHKKKKNKTKKNQKNAKDNKKILVLSTLCRVCL
jgi:hypothetical protein